MTLGSYSRSLPFIGSFDTASLRAAPSSSKISTALSTRTLNPQIHRSLRLSTQHFSSSTSPKSPSATSAPTSDPYYRKQPKSWYKSPALIVLACVPLLTGFLGYWQIQRLKWKLNLIEELEDKLRREPMRLPSNIKSVSVHCYVLCSSKCAYLCPPLQNLCSSKSLLINANGLPVL